jgi:cation:H+ antiporter
MHIIWLAAGLLLLTVGAELLVRGASHMAQRLGISPLIVGLTVVAFGTSTPELIVSINSALAGQSSFALGNVVGSNIFNILFILGICALIVPLRASRQLIRFDVPVMIGLSALVWFLALDYRISSTEGAFLIAGLALYIGILIRQQQKVKKSPYPTTSDAGDEPSRTSHWSLNLLYVVVGLGLLMLGSRWFIQNAIELAQMMGVSEMVIGLTIVAAGTSMPEVVTSIMAALKGERDIAVGNVVGSNIFNILGVLGISSAIAPGGIPMNEVMFYVDIPIMIAVAFACLPILFTGGTIHRWEGALLIGYYVAYTVLLITATDPATGSLFRPLMLYIVLPLTLLTLAVVTWQEFQRRSA